MEPSALGRLAVQPFWSRSYRHFRIRRKGPHCPYGAARSYGICSPASTATGSRFPAGGSGQVAKSV